MSIELTNGSRKALKNAYDLYCKRIKEGKSKTSAVYFDAPGWGGGPKIEGMDDAQNELKAAGFIKTDILGGFELTDKAIILMENRKKDALMGVADFISKFIP